MKKCYFFRVIKSNLLILAVCVSIASQAQNGFLIIKKKSKPVRYIGKDNRLTFRTSNGQWVTGFIDKIEKDSFEYTQEIIRYYTIGTDTFRFKGQRYALSDIKAIPSARQQYYFQNDQVYIRLGREKFAWLRNGFVFQVAGGGYAGLNIINDLYRKDPPFTSKNIAGLGIAAVTFLFGTFLHSRFDPFIRPGKKYQLELIAL
jgi:hypothetical protein